MTKQIHWVLLDIDDTLIDYSMAHKKAFESLLEEVSEYTNQSKEYIKETFDKVKKELYERYPQRYNRHDKVLQIKLFCQALHIHSIPTIIKWIEHYERVYLENIVCFNNTVMLLEYCKRNGIKVILMTNNLLPIQLKVFDKLKLEKLVYTMFTSHEFIYEKPHPQSLKYILREFKIQPEDAIVIGDSESDVVWGEICGIRSILYNKEMDLIQHVV